MLRHGCMAYKKPMSYNKILLIPALCLTLSSCFEDEPANAEADIEQAYVHVDNPTDIFYNATDTLIDVLSDTETISFTVRRTADLTAMAPMFVITEGATIEPESGTVRDFSNGGLTYTVTSEDGQWQRTYTVSFDYATVTANDTVHYDFENYYLDSSSKYYVWSDLDEDGNELNNWATGNPGFQLSRGSAEPEEYPTVPIEDGYDGACVKLETRSTGSFGEMVNKRLAAGNLFLGSFDVSLALIETMQATCFGLPFDRIPIRFTGYYKYQHGDTFQDEDGNVVDDTEDAGRIYAVFYRNHDDDNNSVVLHGDDARTNENIVGKADMGQVADVSEWTYFDIEFEFSEDIDEELLAEQGYNLALIFSSSENGAAYYGAVGSTLYLDKVSIICSDTEE